MYQIFTFLIFLTWGLNASSSSEYQLTLPTFEEWHKSKQKEIELTHELRDGILQVQRIISNRPGNKKIKRRGTHAKGYCVSGTFKVLTDAELSPDTSAKKTLIRHGLFANDYAGKVLQTRYRFANASGKVLADFEKDLRAVSMAIKTDDGLEQHFTFNNSPRFQLPNLQTFVDVLALVSMVEEGSNPLFSFAKLIFQSGFKRAFSAKSAIDMGDEDKAIAKSFSSQAYWSGSAFALGGRPVKLGSYACGLQAQHTQDLMNQTITYDDARQQGENYLKEQLAQKILSGGICQKLFIQFIDETDQYKTIPSKKLVEDTTVIWTGPIHTVAEMNINGKLLTETVCNDPINGLNPVQININLPGLGQINRARSFAESASRAARYTQSP
jgi:catalase